MTHPRLRDVALIPAAWLLAVVLTLPFTWRHVHSQVVVGAPLERQLGFSVSSPFASDPNYFLGQREVVAAWRVEADGPAARAGLREDHVFVEYCSKNRGSTELFRDLERARGGDFCTTVVSLRGKEPLERRARSRICLAVPAPGSNSRRESAQ